ncbi:prolyl aminopeptidase [Oligella urethralis]|uniref:prolyl aminopeptidase n=1 Tax=Oligella urethralis TaxID=90245 RepID=UPI00066022E4|nr:prolyl aminopeptidase [Oligella urethralis]MDK6202349.1 prolyl aminopeptidase [Oligella urethralis]
MYPPIEPYRHGFLDTGEGHQVYWELCGNPQGQPLIFLHGGPGAGCSPQHRQLFDPERYHILLFDQRGCGRSKPTASLENNTTPQLISDMERLRAEILQVDQYVVFGGSWGSTLALAYAQAHPNRVKGLILRGIFTLRKEEVQWFYQSGASFIFPDEWEKYLAPIPAAEHDDLVSAYHRRLTGHDEAEQLRCAYAWAQWESNTISLLPTAAKALTLADRDAVLSFARIENHYFKHAGFMEEGQLLRDAHRLADIPTIIIQGRYDCCTPAKTAWELSKAMPHAAFHLIPDAGHAFNEPGILAALLDATDKFATL